MTDYLTTLFYLNKHCVSLPSPRKDNLREGGFIWVQDSGHFSPSFHRSQQAEREREGKGRKREGEQERERWGGESLQQSTVSLSPLHSILIPACGPLAPTFKTGFTSSMNPRQKCPEVCFPNFQAFLTLLQLIIKISYHRHVLTSSPKQYCTIQFVVASSTGLHSMMS